ncbi:MAG: hypothetical protein AB4041_15860 [Microcystaceae cyanobacterium]
MNQNPQHNSGSRLYRHLGKWGKSIIKSILGLLKLIFSLFWDLISKLNNRDRITAVILIILWVGVLFSNFILKGSYIFEGNLIVKEMSFTYNGSSDRRFLNIIDNITTLDIQGIQPQPLILTGQFTSDDNTINQKLNNIKQLKLDFNQPDSRFILTSEQPNLSLLSLDIQPQISINQLTHNFPNHQLSFCLISSSQSANTCGVIDYYQSAKPQKIANLTLILTQQPFTLRLDQVNLPQLNTNTNQDQEIELQFIPDAESSEKILTLNDVAKIQITTTPIDNKKTINWFRGDIDVKNVSFQEFDTIEKASDEIINSTILKGEVRLANKKLELQEKQFLIVNQPNPGIRKLRSLQIHPNSPQGLQTFISGESRGIAVGLYKQFPVETLKPSLLSKYLSQEAVNALLALIGAFTGIFLPRLFSRETD